MILLKDLNFAGYKSEKQFYCRIKIILLGTRTGCQNVKIFYCSSFLNFRVITFLVSAQLFSWSNKIIFRYSAKNLDCSAKLFSSCTRATYDFFPKRSSFTLEIQAAETDRSWPGVASKRVPLFWQPARTYARFQHTGRHEYFRFRGETTTACLSFCLFLRLSIRVPPLSIRFFEGKRRDRY